MHKSELIREVHDRTNNKLAMKELDLRWILNCSMYWLHSSWCFSFIDGICYTYFKIKKKHFRCYLYLLWLHVLFMWFVTMCLMWCRIILEVDSMKRLVIIFFTVLPIALFANDSQCYSIKNSDQKNYCLALAKNKDSYCYSIQESDSKNLCLAQVKNQKSYCYSIKASDSKNQCLAVVK